MQESTPLQVLTIAEDITLEHRDSIQIYSVSTVKTKAIDEWIRTVIYSLKTASSRDPLRLIYDLSNISILNLMSSRSVDVGTIGITMAGNDEALVVLKARPELRVYLAIVMQPSLSAKVTKVAALKVVGYERKFQFNVPAACKWLLANPQKKLGANNGISSR